MKSIIFWKVTPCNQVLMKYAFNYADEHFSCVNNFYKFPFGKAKGKVIHGLNQLSTMP